jgi:hypothetical protein
LVTAVTCSTVPAETICDLCARYATDTTQRANKLNLLVSNSTKQLPTDTSRLPDKRQQLKGAAGVPRGLICRCGRLGGFACSAAALFLHCLRCCYCNL